MLLKFLQTTLYAAGLINLPSFGGGIGQLNSESESCVGIEIF